MRKKLIIFLVFLIIMLGKGASIIGGTLKLNIFIFRHGIRESLIQ